MCQLSGCSDEGSHLCNKILVNLIFLKVQWMAWYQPFSIAIPNIWHHPMVQRAVHTRDTDVPVRIWVVPDAHAYRSNSRCMYETQAQDGNTYTHFCRQCIVNSSMYNDYSDQSHTLQRYYNVITPKHANQISACSCCQLVRLYWPSIVKQAAWQCCLKH